MGYVETDETHGHGSIRHYDCTYWTTPTTEDRFACNAFTSVGEDTKGNLWFGTGDLWVGTGELAAKGRGVFRYDGEHFKNWLKQCKESVEVMVERIDSAGYKYFAEEGENLYRIWMKNE